MARHNMPAAHGNEVNVTPLIDVVMCLIIFFMLVAKIGVSNGADSTIDIPATYLGKNIESLSDSILLNVRVPAGSGLDSPDISTTVAGEQKSLPVRDTIRGAQVFPLREALIKLKKLQPQLKVIIRADSNLQYRFLEPILINCAEAGVQSVNFNTKKELHEVPAK